MPETNAPAVTGQGEGGEVLGEEARAAFRIAYAEFKRGYDWHDEEAVAAGLDAMSPLVAALVAQARDQAIFEAKEAEALAVARARADGAEVARRECGCMDCEERSIARSPS